MIIHNIHMTWWRMQHISYFYVSCFITCHKYTQLISLKKGFPFHFLSLTFIKTRVDNYIVTLSRAFKKFFWLTCRHFFEKLDKKWRKWRFVLPVSSKLFFFVDKSTYGQIISFRFSKKVFGLSDTPWNIYTCLLKFLWQFSKIKLHIK